MFSPDQIKHASARQEAIPTLEKLGNVWIGADIAMEKPTVIPAQGYIPDAKVVLSKKNLPPLDISRGILSSLNLSVRSFFAQTGLEILFHDSAVSDQMLKDLQEGKNISVPVEIRNHGQRAVEVEGDVMRFFWVNERNRLRGTELLNAIKSGDIIIGGKEGEDWYIGGWESEDKFLTTGEGSDKGLCIVARLKPERFYIPLDTDPVKKDPNKSIREDLANLLQPIPEGMNLPLEIGETQHIDLAPDIVLVINMGAEQGQRHIYSPLLDRGGWPMRTETLHGMEYIDLFLYRR